MTIARRWRARHGRASPLPGSGLKRPPWLDAYAECGDTPTSQRLTQVSSDSRAITTSELNG